MNASVFDSLEDNNFLQIDGTHLASESETANFLNDEGPHKTVWMIYDRQFADGQREICATKTVRFRQNGPLDLPNRAKRGESEKREENDDDSAKRAKQAVRHRCKAIAADRMLTLTYRENMQDMERLQKDFDLFRRRMSRAKKFHYVAIVEPQERGAFHMHIAVHGRQCYHFVRSVWQSIVGKDAEGRQMGQINVRNPNKFGFGAKDNHKLAAYITKYITKDQGNHELNKKRYWSSRGIVIPEKNYYQLPYGADESTAFSHVMELAASHNNQGMVFFSNQALGVCWVATGPVS